MGRTDRATLLVHVDRARAFDALTNSEALLDWLPPAGMHGRFEQFDMREGGSYRLILTYEDASDAPGKTSADADASTVRVVQIIPDPAFAGTMRMEWNLHDDQEGTIVEVVARNVPTGVRARDHAAGLTSSLANLAAHLEP
jgi:uncharacterized protein YndB with AHSA1/START domain